MADTFETDLRAWVDAQPEGTIDPDKYAAAAARIGKKYGIEDTPENRTYFRDFAVKEYSSPGESVWQAARADPVMRSAAPSFSETQSVPLAEGYQQANLDMLARMPRGSTDPEAYATAREDLDRKYGYAVTPEQHKAYVDWASKYYNDQSRGLNVSVPDPTAPLTGVDYARNQIIADPMGAALASYANARGFGGTELLLDLGARYGLNAPGQMDALSEANPYTAMAGDALGMVGAANQLGRIGADLAGRYAPMLLRGGRGADGLRMAAVDAAYGGARGAVTSPEDPLMGAVEGAAEFGLPTFGLQAAGSALGRLAPRGFGRDGDLAARPAFNVSEEGPFLNVAREDVAPQIVPEMRSAPNIRAMREIMADPENNPALRMANDLAVQRTGAPLPSDLPVASFRRQSGIARAQRAAAEGSPEYKSATFEAYGNQMPELVEQTGAQNYDQFTEAAYRAFADEAKQQFYKLPVKTRFHYGEGEYATPSSMFRDVLGEGNLNVFRGGDPHPYLSDVDPVTGLTPNEMFRADHDFIGHLARGATFRPGGEEIAFATHAPTMSPLAQLALLSETRGQNSLVNFSPLNVDLMAKTGPIKARITELQNMDAMRGRPGASAGEIADLNRQLRELGRETIFAPNVPGLLPPEYLNPMTPGGVPDWLRSVIRPEFGTAPERAVHLSHTPGLTATDPSFYGTGHRGRDWDVRGAKGSPSEKTSFYLGDTGTVRPEKMVADVSPYGYETLLSNLYDIGQDPERLAEFARVMNFGRPAMRNTVPAWVPDLMRLTREYGYAGIRNPEFKPGQAAADVFDPVEGLRAIERGPEGYAMGGLAVRKAA